MSKLKILLSGPKNNNLEHYVSAVNKAGAEAVVKHLPDTDTNYDGLILTGGSDVDPKYYNEPVDGAVGIDNERDAAEFAILEAFVAVGKPVMGICRGHQLINVFFGGSLYQHLPESDLHRSATGEKIVHEVTAIHDSILDKLYGTLFAVNSTHHQAVKNLGIGLRATAYWADKYVEAYEHTSLPVLGVQWHPERMDTGAKIFEHFIKMCEKEKNKTEV